MNPLAARIPLVLPPVEFGSGALDAVAAFARQQGAQRPLVVADAFNAQRVQLLALPGQVALFGEVVPEPDVPNLERALALAREVQPDLVIGFGGGSAMDLAKLVAVLARGTQTVHEVVGPDKVAGPRIPLVQVPTTAGTGSEIGTRALVSDPVSRNKLAVQSRLMLADLAVIDPALTMSVPPSPTAAAGIDAMTHCVEALTNRKAHPLIDHYALEGIRLVGRHLPVAVRDGADADARAGLALAALYGGICLGPVNTTAGHAVAYPLGTRHHIAHGLSCAVIFPHALAFNAGVAAERTSAVLQAMGLPDDLRETAIVEHATRWCADLGVEMRMSRLGIPEHDLDAMAGEAFAIRRLLDNNPREISREQIRSIYQAAY
ncbi:MAG: iron-containing alcohol dehydrogenase [Burkholderiaceae bacterium]|nr:iron-containing alcohol dehydrogenase [Burkholderiaceae bacterium]